MAEVFAVVQIARQVSGEGDSAMQSYVGVIFHKAFTDKNKADQMAIKLSQDASKKGEQTVMTPHGPIKIVVSEVGVQPMELEG